MPQKVPYDLTTSANEQVAGATLPAGSAVSPVEPSATTLPAVSRSGGVPAPVVLPRPILMRLPVTLWPAMRILIRHAPLVAGQDRKDYLALIEIAIGEWRPQTFQECALLKQQVDAEWEILTLQQVQASLFNCAIGAQFSTLLKASDTSVTNSEQDQIQAQTVRNVIFAALAGEDEAVTYLEARTGRNIGVSPETPAYFAPTIPIHLFADRAITTRLARRDAAVRELSRTKAERSSRMAGFVDIADIRSHLSLSEYIRLTAEADLYKQAEPELYVEQLSAALNRRKTAVAAAEEGTADPVKSEGAVEETGAPSSPGDEFFRELERRKNAKSATVAAAEKDDDTVTVRVPRTIGPGESPE